MSHTDPPMPKYLLHDLVMRLTHDPEWFVYDSWACSHCGTTDKKYDDDDDDMIIDFHHSTFCVVPDLQRYAKSHTE